VPLCARRSRRRRSSAAASGPAWPGPARLLLLCQLHACDFYKSSKHTTPLAIGGVRAAGAGHSLSVLHSCRAHCLDGGKIDAKTSCAVNQSLIILGIVRAGARVNEQTKAEISCALAERERERERAVSDLRPRTNWHLPRTSHPHNATDCVLWPFFALICCARCEFSISVSMDAAAAVVLT